MPHDLSPDQLEELWICEKHRGNMGKNWRPRRTFQYPLHNGWKKQLNTRNAVHLDMSREINTIFVELVPTGSLEYDFYVNSSLPTRYCPEMWGRVQIKMISKHILRCGKCQNSVFWNLIEQDYCEYNCVLVFWLFFSGDPPRDLCSASCRNLG